MRIIRTERQRESLARFCWNMAQISLGALVIAPITKPETVQAGVVIVGVAATMAFMVLGYILDGMEVQR